jgi:hypothetical protein
VGPHKRPRSAHLASWLYDCDHPENQRKADPQLHCLAAIVGALGEAVGIEEAIMPTTIPTFVGTAKVPWNRGRLIGQKRPLKPKEVWAIRVRLQLEGRKRDFALCTVMGLPDSRA